MVKQGSPRITDDTTQMKLKVNMTLIMETYIKGMVDTYLVLTAVYEKRRLIS